MKAVWLSHLFAFCLSSCSLSPLQVWAWKTCQTCCQSIGLHLTLQSWLNTHACIHTQTHTHMHSEKKKKRAYLSYVFFQACKHTFTSSYFHTSTTNMCPRPFPVHAPANTHILAISAFCLCLMMESSHTLMPRVRPRHDRATFTRSSLTQT